MLNKKELVLATIVFIISFALLTFAFQPGFLPKGTEVIEKRNYNLKSYSNGDGTYQAKVFSDTIHFFDGMQWIEMEQMADKEIKKEFIEVKEKPLLGENGFTSFLEGTYKLHSGISTELKENQLFFKDAKGKTIKQLAVPYAWDAKENKIEIFYKPEIQGNDLKLFVEVPNNWLENAVYPIIVDSNSTITGDLGDGRLRKNSTVSWAAAQAATPIVATANTADTAGTYKQVTGAYRIDRIFLSFDTSPLTGNTISAATLNVSLDSYTGCVIDWQALVYSGSGNCFGELDTGDWSNCTNYEDIIYRCTQGTPGVCGSPPCWRETIISTGAINVDGNSQFRLNSSDETTEPTSLAFAKENFNMSDYADTGSDPYLEIEYSGVVPEFSFLALIAAIFISVAFVALIRKRI